MATTYTTNYNLGKQENHADKFDMDVITDNADKIDAALTGLQSGIDGKQATLTAAQLAAVNSGITSADVEQITENENNILTVADQTTQYNYSSVSSMSGTSGFTSAYYFDRPIPTGTYRLVCTNVRTDTSKQCQFQVVGANASEQYANLSPTILTANYVTNEFTTTFDLYGIKVYCNTPIEITNLAIIPKALYDTGFTSYQPYAMSNAELTQQTNELTELTKGLVLIAHNSAQGNSGGLTYTPKATDFEVGNGANDRNSGSYLLYCVNWSTTGQPYIALITFSGGQIASLTKTIIVNGFEPTVDLTGGIITVSTCARASLYALR